MPFYSSDGSTPIAVFVLVKHTVVILREKEKGEGEIARPSL